MANAFLVAAVICGHPDVFPITYLVDHGTVVFRTAGGTKFSAAAGAPIAFEADGRDPGINRAWSVVVRGYGETVAERDLLDSAELPPRPWLGARVSA